MFFSKDSPEVIVSVIHTLGGLNLIEGCHRT